LKIGAFLFLCNQLPEFYLAFVVPHISGLGNLFSNQY